MATYDLVGVTLPTDADGLAPLQVNPAEIGQQIRDITEQIGAAFDASAVAGLPLKAFQLGLTLTEGGSIGFLGFGAKADAEESITLTFERA